MKKIIINYSVPILFSSVIISLILSVLYLESELVFIAVIPAVYGIFIYFRYFTASILDENNKILNRSKAFIHIIICILLLIIVCNTLSFTKYFILASVFISFIVYYEFTVRYNALIAFLLTIIPCAIYKSRNIEININYFCTLISLYFLFMLICKKKHMEKYAEVIYSKSYYISLVFLTAVFFVTAALIPKLRNTPYNLFKNGINFGNNLSADYSSYLYNYSGNGTPPNENLNRVLFLVEAEDAVYLRRQVMGDYVSSRSAFQKLQGDYFGTGYKHWETEVFYANLTELFNCIKEVGSRNEAFYEKYGDIIEALPETEETTSEAIITYVDLSTEYIPVTLRTYRVSGDVIDELNHYRTPDGTIFLSWQNNEKIISGNSFIIEYYNEQIRISKELQDFTSLFTLERYTELITDLNTEFANDIFNIGNQLTMNKYMNQITALYEYQKEINYELPKSISKLAEEITKGKDSDFEKALALESYFADNGYRYDQTYIPANNESIEHFIFTGKRGTCSSYAAAMTLMARAVGLPARYVEGFKTGQKNNEGIYEITPLNAHAFPEIFIAGYGWVTFEPTVSYKLNLLKLLFDKNVIKLFIFTVVVLASAAIIVYLYTFISKKADEWIFRKRFAASCGKTFAIMMYTRMQKIVNKNSGIDVRTLTPRMFSEFVFEKYAFDLLYIITILEQAVYGDVELMEENYRYLIDKYIEFYKGIKRK